MCFKQQNINKMISIYFINLCTSLNQIIYIKKNCIIFYMILRKFKTKYNNNKPAKFVFFLSSLIFTKAYNFLYLFKNQSFLIIFIILLKFYAFFLKKQLLKLDNLKLKNYSNISTWVIKKQPLRIKFDNISFFVLFDNLKFSFVKKHLYSLFKYYQLNHMFFKNIFYIYIKLYLQIFDKFIFYVFKKFNLILSHNLFFKKLFLYLRLNNSFLLKINTKSFYLSQLIYEIIYFIIIKTKLNITIIYLTAVKHKYKNVYFLALKTNFITKLSYLLLKLDFKKIVVRFFFLGYVTNLNNVQIKFKQFLVFNQFSMLIKLKLILYSIIFYYNIFKNKKYIVFKIIQIFKNSILKFLNMKLNYNSKTQILTLLKHDISRFMVKRL